METKKITYIIIGILILVGIVAVMLQKPTETETVVTIPPDSMTEELQVSPVGEKKEKVQRIVIDGHKIQNQTVIIPVGTTVIFENKDSFAGLPYDAHTVTTGVVDPSGKTGVAGKVPNSGSGIADSIINAPLGAGDTFTYTFEKAETITFYIAEHPLVSGQGTITVAAEEETPDGVITMDSGSFYFAPNVLKAKVGEEVNIDITSSGLHTFTIDALGVDVPTQDGVTTRVSFTPETAGTYTYYCAIPGHTEAGQIGTLTVTE